MVFIFIEKWVREGVYYCASRFSLTDSLEFALEPRGLSENLMIPLPIDGVIELQFQCWFSMVMRGSSCYYWYPILWQFADHNSPFASAAWARQRKLPLSLFSLFFPLVVPTWNQKLEFIHPPSSPPWRSRQQAPTTPPPPPPSPILYQMNSPSFPVQLPLRPPQVPISMILVHPEATNQPLKSMDQHRMPITMWT